MAGHLQISPFIKSYDEILRSKKRQQTYLDLNGHLLSEPDRLKLERLIEHLDKALTYIPEEYKLTKHDLRKQKDQ